MCLLEPGPVSKYNGSSAKEGVFSECSMPRLGDKKGGCLFDKAPPSDPNFLFFLKLY